MQVLLVVVLGEGVAAALLREYVHHDGPGVAALDGRGERALEFLDVVSVDRPDVVHTEGLEERWRLEELAHGGLERLCCLFRLATDDGQVAQERFQLALTANVHGVHADVR